MTDFALRVAFVLTLSFLLASCGGSSLPSNDRLIDAFQEGRTGIWVSGHGTVAQMPADELGNTPRQRFAVRISPNLTVLVRHELDESLRVPAQRGDTLAFQGYYEWDGSGGTISRTFADASRAGGGGWIEHEGTRYD